MTDILIDATAVTPYVRIDSDESHIIFMGKSSPPNSLSFYHPLITKIKILFAESIKPIQVDLSFRYFNTSTSKCLFDFFKMMKGLVREGKTVIINWHYEEDDEDMLETGEDYADILSLDFRFIEVEDIKDVLLKEVVRS
ncbi:MAG: archaellum biogenesis ATPase FlaH [Cyclobacteriaceae bacterium]|jgi:archaellum biogenesis ATPase FlaH